jgi:uncharacterized protein YndB with AHSA1/START domain
MTPPDAGTTFVQEIIIKAPAERVFAALINPDQREEWWGSEGSFLATHVASDPRVGANGA